MSECNNCGKQLFDAMVKAWPDKSLIVVNEMLPNVTPSTKIVNLPVEKLMMFNAQYKELAEFVAWTCGTRIEDLCRLHMMSYTMNTCADKVALDNFRDFLQNNPNEAGRFRDVVNMLDEMSVERLDIYRQIAKLLRAIQVSI